MIQDYDTYFFLIFKKPCYPLKAPNAPKIQTCQNIVFKIQNVSINFKNKINRTFYFDFLCITAELYAIYVQKIHGRLIPYIEK